MTDNIEDDEDNRDEYSTRDEPRQKSFYDRYRFDERDGPAEEEEGGGTWVMSMMQKTEFEVSADRMLLI